jgi:hypothetical protein
MNKHCIAIVLALSLGATGARAQDDLRTLGKTTTEWLQLLREGKESRFRRAALIALESIGPQKTVLSGLYEALEKDADPQVRREVAQLLGRMGTDAKGAAATLASSVRNDKDGSVREAAAAALGGKLADEAQAYVAVLAGALKDKHPGTRAAATESLKNMGAGALVALPALAAVARDRQEDRLTRVHALQILTRLGKDENDTPAILVAVLKDAEAPPGVREAAAEGVGKLGCSTPACVAVLSEALTAKSGSLRLAAATALNALGDRAGGAWPAIKAGLKDADSGLRNQLIRAAGALVKEQPEAVAALAERAMGDDATENRLAAIQELGEAGAAARSAEAVLDRIAAQDARARLRDAATKALKKVKG